MENTVLWQRLEGAVIFIAGIALFLCDGNGVSWWTAVLIFFAPDLSFAGYALGVRIGAFFYNLVHIYALGFAALVVGLVFSQPLLASCGTLWVAHAGFDRMLGYGLKSTQGFTVTHLGRIGNTPRG